MTITLSADQFIYNPSIIALAAEASALGIEPGEVFDPIILWSSTVAVVYTLAGTEYDRYNDIAYWHYSPITLAAENLELVIEND
jgi:hypothetical protein